MSVSCKWTLLMGICVLGVGAGYCAATSYRTAILAIWSIIWLIACIAVAACSGAAGGWRYRMICWISLYSCVSMLVALLIGSQLGILGAYYPDERFYIDGGLQIANLLCSGEWPNFSEVQRLAGTRNAGFHYFVASHFLVLPDRMLPVLSLIGLSAMAAVFAARIGNVLFGETVARRTLWFQLANPGVLYWSSFVLKDVLIGFLVVSVVTFYYRVSSRFNLLVLLVMLSLLSALLTLRFYMFFVLLSVLVVAFAINRLQNVYTRALTLVLVTAILGLSVVASPVLQERFGEALEMTSWDAVLAQSEKSTEIATKREGFFSRYQSLSPVVVVHSALHFLLAPSPLNLEGDGKYLVAGGLFWYAMLPYVSLGLVTVMRRDWRRLLPVYGVPLLLVLVTALNPAISEPRHRVMAYPLFAVLAAVGSLGSGKARTWAFALVWLAIGAAVAWRQQWF
ncbi:MAG: hypothetical protein QXP27_03390 [Candidatus Methanomethyliaceae archaeon]